MNSATISMATLMRTTRMATTTTTVTSTVIRMNMAKTTEALTFIRTATSIKLVFTIPRMPPNSISAPCRICAVT